MAEKKYKILIVDDDKFLLTMYVMKFKKHGFDAVSSVGSNDALEKLRGGFSPDILVLDIIMPGVDGLELLSIIRKEKLAPDAVVIMLTNQGGSEEIEKAKSLGANSYIVKATSIPSEVVEEVLKIAESNSKK
ncbi:MAG: response regulator [Parcubacteria group bacterium]|nr:response regulator [Parcubacteria group bacterium]